jgi:hypothetical protein
VYAYIQRHLPGHATRMFLESTDRTITAFETLLTDFTSRFVPAWQGDADEQNRPIYGWWNGIFGYDGASYEICLVPNEYGNGEFVVAGPTKAGVNTLVEKVIEEATKHTTRCLRFTGGRWVDAPDMEDEVSGTDWTDIVLSPSLLTDIQQNIAAFFSQKELFHRLGFAWRRGILLVGPPGTGKTMICKAAARSHTDVPFLYVRDMRSNRAADTLSSIFSRARRLAPCILAIEDMDGLIDRDNRTMFLNELDGFKNNDGLLIIATSNHPERIDEALLKRPSRFDRVYHIGVPERTERAEYSRRLLAKSPMPLVGFETAELADRVADATEGFTPAFIKEAFLSAMLAAAQSGQTELGAAFGDAVLEQADLLRKYLKKARNPESLAEFLPSTGGEIGFRSR